MFASFFRKGTVKQYQKELRYLRLERERVARQLQAKRLPYKVTTLSLRQQILSLSYKIAVQNRYIKRLQ